MQKKAKRRLHAAQRRPQPPVNDRATKEAGWRAAGSTKMHKQTTFILINFIAGRQHLALLTAAESGCTPRKKMKFRDDG